MKSKTTKYYAAIGQPSNRCKTKTLDQMEIDLRELERATPYVDAIGNPDEMSRHKSRIEALKRAIKAARVVSSPHGTA